MTDKPAEERPRWLDRKENVTKIVRALYAVCAVVILADLVARTHPENQIDAVPFFYGVFAFLGSIFLVMAVKFVRKILSRSEDYYDD